MPVFAVNLGSRYSYKPVFCVDVVDCTRIDVSCAIVVVEVTAGTPAPGVDTPEDLARVRALFAAERA